MRELRKLKQWLSFIGIFLLLLIAAVTIYQPVNSQGTNDYYLVCVTAYKTGNVTVISYYVLPLEAVEESINSNETLVSFINEALGKGENLTYLGTAEEQAVYAVLKLSIPQCVNKTNREATEVWIVKGVKHLSEIKLSYPYLLAASATRQSMKEGTLTAPTYTYLTSSTATSPAVTMITPTITKTATNPSITTYKSITSPSSSASVTRAQYSIAERHINILLSKPLAVLMGVIAASLAVLITYELIIRK